MEPRHENHSRNSILELLSEILCWFNGSRCNLGRLIAKNVYFCFQMLFDSLLKIEGLRIPLHLIVQMISSEYFLDQLTAQYFQLIPTLSSSRWFQENYMAYVNKFLLYILYTELYKKYWRQRYYKVLWLEKFGLLMSSGCFSRPLSTTVTQPKILIRNQLKRT